MQWHQLLSSLFSKRHQGHVDNVGKTSNICSCYSQFTLKSIFHFVQISSYKEDYIMLNVVTFSSFMVFWPLHLLNFLYSPVTKLALDPTEVIGLPVATTNMLSLSPFFLCLHWTICTQLDYFLPSR